MLNRRIEFNHENFPVGTKFIYRFEDDRTEFVEAEVHRYTPDYSAVKLWVERLDKDPRFIWTETKELNDLENPIEFIILEKPDVK